MEEGDPYFCVQDEVVRNLQSAKSLYDEWRLNTANQPVKLKQLLKNIEWDLMDLQETVAAVEKNPSRFSLSEKDLFDRHQFVTGARNVLKFVRRQLNLKSSQAGARESIDFTVPVAPRPSSSSQMPCNIVGEHPSEKRPTDRGATLFNHPSLHSTAYTSHIDPLTEQQNLLRDQDTRLDQLGASISTLKDISHRMGDELSDQVMLLRDFSSEMVHTESKLDAVTRRTTKLLHLSTDRRQWCAIAVLLTILIIILVLLVLL